MIIFSLPFVGFALAWILGLALFHVASGLMHILLILAAISLCLHFVRHPRRIA